MTSEFIPKMVYRYFYSGDGSLNGYVDFSLSYFDMRDFDQISKDLKIQGKKYRILIKENSITCQI